jgi:hypothetical protein
MYLWYICSQHCLLMYASFMCTEQCLYKHLRTQHHLHASELSKCTRSYHSYTATSCLVACSSQ